MHRCTPILPIKPAAGTVFLHPVSLASAPRVPEFRGYGKQRTRNDIEGRFSVDEVQD